jgi:copper resistance protein D
MAWFLLDFALLSVALRAAILAFESLVLGGIAFVAVAGLPAGPAGQAAIDRCRKGIRWSAAALAIVQLLYVAVDTAILLGTLPLSFHDVIAADYFIAGMASVLASTALFLMLRKTVNLFSSRARFILTLLPFAAVLISSSVWTSHAVARLDHRGITALLTGAHQLAVAAWIGAMPFLLVSLGVEQEASRALILARRFSAMAVLSVAALVTAGLGLSYFYIGSWGALSGTAYGFMVLTKSALLGGLLVLGAANWWLVRSLKNHTNDVVEEPTGSADQTIPKSLLLIGRLGEAEIGIGFSIILAAASLTSQPPAIDMVRDRLTTHEIVERFRPAMPRFSSPAVDELAPATPLEEAVHSFDNSEVAWAHSHRDPDMAFSEASHHWAGLILLAIGAGAWMSRSRRFPWARFWPLGFAALSIFTFVRADPENWPLGPVSFWKSFYDPEVLEHRVFDVLLLMYAIFESGVQTGRLKSRAAAYVFPLLMALGGAVLLLHNHALGNAKDELLIEMSHNSMAVLAVFAGWARWVDVRSPQQLPRETASRIAAQIWPICLVLIGCLLLNYREA